MANPWGAVCRVREGRHVLVETAATVIRFRTRAGGIYTLEPAEAPLSGYRPAAIEDEPNQSPGLPGRD